MKSPLRAWDDRFGCRDALRVPTGSNSHRRCNSVITNSCNPKIFLVPSGKSLALVRSSRATEGRFAIVTIRWRGMRWTLRRQAGFCPTRSPQRTAKSCGPGAATVASIPAGLCWRDNGDNQRRSPGRARISRQPIARGRPGCLGCTCQTRVRSSTTHCTRTSGRSRRPAFPAPSVQEGANEMASLGQTVSRE